jgi:hypothetical protein
MSYFIFPQRWIGPAIAAAALSFGPVEKADDVHIRYVNFPGQSTAGIRPPDDIGIDKRPKSFWLKWRAQCTIVHQYGHLAGRKHSSNPRSMMYPTLNRQVCERYRARHGLR